MAHRTILQPLASSACLGLGLALSILLLQTGCDEPSAAPKQSASQNKDAKPTAGSIDGADGERQLRPLGRPEPPPPAAFPRNLLYPGARIFTAVGDDKKMYLFLETTDLRPKAVQTYEALLNQNGWRLLPDDPGGTLHEYEKDGDKLKVSIEESSTGSDVHIELHLK
jgi:hypothetical protein